MDDVAPALEIANVADSRLEVRVHGSWSGHHDQSRFDELPASGWNHPKTGRGGIENGDQNDEAQKSAEEKKKIVFPWNLALAVLQR